MNDDSIKYIYYWLQGFRAAVLYFPLCGNIIQKACADKNNVLKGGWRKSGCEHQCKEGWSETNIKGEVDKVRQVKTNRTRVWGVSCDVERWSWGSGRKGRPPEGRRNTQLNLIHFRAVNLHFPRGNLWLCSLGNSVFAASGTEPVEECRDLRKLPISHIFWQWIKPSQTNTYD